MSAGSPTRLRVEHLERPLGIDAGVPRFSWWLPGGAERQLAYRIRTDNGWDSGRVDGERNVLVEYLGPALVAGQSVGWSVQVWTDLGESDWAPSHQFEVARTDPQAWSARWIAPHEPEPAAPGERPAFRLRAEFELETPTADARLYATAHGIYEAFLNGERLGDAELTPGYTEYRMRLQVQSYDVSDGLRPGVNVIEVLLSDGWYRGQVGLPRAHDQWGSQLGLLAELTIDGVSVCATGPGWQSSRSEVQRADLIAGQTTDFTRQTDHDWHPAPVVEDEVSGLVGACAPPVRRVQELTPVSVSRGPGGQLFDLGQNINGWVRLRDLGPAGTEITLSHGEALDAAGEFTTAHLNVDLPFLPAPLPAGQVDRVVSAGRAGQIFEPRHTTHGFRFVLVEGHPGELTTADLTGVVVHSDLTRTGWFECSDERLNRLHDAAVWSFRGNACEIPTDCPTRERAGWTGDWQVFCPTAAFLYDVAGFSTKWLRDLAAEQWSSGLVANLAPSPASESQAGFLAAMNGSAGWGDAAVIVPWQMYLAYGDRRLLAEQWQSMVAWMAHVERSAAGARHPDRAQRHPDLRPHDRFLWDSGFHWGEWLVPGADLKGPDEFEAFRVSDKADVATAYYALSAGLIGRIAAVLGRDSDAGRYAALAENVRAAWQAEFISPAGEIRPDTQANLVRALAFGLIPAALRERASDRLVELIRAAGTHLGTGFLATPYLLPVLAQNDRLDIAYELLQTDTEPSWLYMIERGATTMWERWNGIAADGTPYESLNHYSKGAVVSFLHRHVAGIQLLDEGPGYRHFRIAPQPGGGISWANARHDSPHGTIESSWRADADGLELSLTVPPGTSAEVALPDGQNSVLGPGRHTVRSAARVAGGVAR